MSKILSYGKHALFYLFLAAYVLLLAQILIFKNVSPQDILSADRYIYRTFNFIPFKSIIGYFHGKNIWISLMNVVGNIVIFVPLGIYFQIFCRNKKILSSVLLVFAFSLFVEVAQGFLAIGATDVDDVILNTLGGAVGVLIYKFLFSVLKDENKARTATTVVFGVVCLCALAFVGIVRASGLMIRFL